MFIYHRSNLEKTGCPFCSNKKTCSTNSLLFTHPELCKEWDYNTNFDVFPEQIVGGSNRVVSWVCSSDKEHKWQASIASRIGGRGCPFCVNRLVCFKNSLLFTHPELCKEWDYDKNEIKPGEITSKSGKSVFWICSKNKEHKWKTAPLNRVLGKTGCPRCSKRNSNLENEWLASFSYIKIEKNVYLNINGKKFYPDGFCERTKTVFEFHGDYYHGNLSVFDSNTINKKTKLSFGEMNLRTQKKHDAYVNAGYNVVFIWEKDFYLGIMPSIVYGNRLLDGESFLRKYAEFVFNT